MHGLKTIHQLNTLAAQNAPGAAETALAEAEASREGKPSNLAIEQAHFQAERKAKREAVIAELTAKSCEDLISLSRGCGVECTPLEAALANKLDELTGQGAFVTPKRYALPV